MSCAQSINACLFDKTNDAAPSIAIDLATRQVVGEGRSAPANREALRPVATDTVSHSCNGKWSVCGM